MKRIHFIFMFAFLCFTACSKNNERSYAYWSNLVNEKHQEIDQLTQSVPCSSIDDFEIVNKNGYYLVHPSIKANFDRLMVELDRLQEESYRAASREGIMIDLRDAPNPPVKAACKDGKPTLIYAQDLNLSEVKAELETRYPQIQNFYADVPCTDPSAWISMAIQTGCCSEGIAAHKTIRTAEFLELLFTYSRLTVRKLYLEGTKCEGGCPGAVQPVTCVNGRPYVALTNN